MNSKTIGQIAIPAAIVGIVVMMVVPLPTALLDLLLVSNIAMATVAPVSYTHLTLPTNREV